MLGADRPGPAAIFAEFALVNTADALLQLNGWRVRGKNSSHEARFDFPGLPQIFTSNSALIDEVRSLRNEEAYGPTHPVSMKQASDLVELAEGAIDEVRKVIPSAERST